METFDAQMFDSGDGDIPMFTGAGPSESWLSVEATMADESNNADIQTYHPEQSVEIEMADHDDEITEYEMADEREYARDNDAEVVDVDLVDVSRQASPPPGVSTLSASHFSPEAPSSYERGLSLASFGHPVDPAHEAPANEIVEHPIAPQVVDTPNSVTLPGTDSSPTGENAVNSGVVLQQAPETVVAAALTPASEVRVPEEASTTEAVAVNGDPENALAPTITEIEEPQVIHTVEDRDRGDHSSNPHQADRLPSLPPTSSMPTEQVVASDMAPPQAEASHASHPDAGAAYEQEATQTGTIEDSTQNADPHEISEGVYIDPPPAVLLTVSSSAQPIDCCLFNQPIRSSGSQSPSTSSAAESALLLLLHHRPTLYYEPLSIVFEALPSNSTAYDSYPPETSAPPPNCH